MAERQVVDLGCHDYVWAFPDPTERHAHGSADGRNGYESGNGVRPACDWVIWIGGLRNDGLDWTIDGRTTRVVAGRVPL
jgi:hypothetical protein